MKAWKWTALALASGIVLQLSACATDLGFYLLQALATQLAAAALTAATGAA